MMSGPCEAPSALKQNINLVRSRRSVRRDTWVASPSCNPAAPQAAERGSSMSTSKGSAGTSQSSSVPSTTTRRKPKFNPRSIFFPFTVVILGGLFFIYSRTSIQAAKENAKRAREADGGSINWRNEGLRRHGALEKPEERSLWQQLINPGDGDDATKERRAKENRRLEMEGRRMRQSNPIEEGIRRAREEARQVAERKDGKDG